MRRAASGASSTKAAAIAEFPGITPRSALSAVLIGAGTVIILGVFALLIVRNVAEMRTLRDQTFAVEHTLEVQRELDALLLNEVQADAAVRLYLMTETADSLRQVALARQSASDRLRRVAELVGDSASQTTRVSRLREAMATHAARLDRVIDARRRSGLDAAIVEARAAATGTSRGDIQALVSQMEDDEARLLAVRRDEAEIAYRRAMNGRVGSGLVSAGLLIAIALTAGLHARSKARREAALMASEQKAHEAAAREQEARAEAERVNREKDQFLAVLSHELRTPLNAVLGWTQILQGSSSHDPTTTRGLASIRRNAEAQRRLVEDLLDVSRIISGKLPFEREPYHLNAAIVAVVDSIRPSAEANGLTLITDLDQTPPSLGDSGRIQQVVSNLLSNAVKFTPAGGHITVRLCDGGDVAQFEVTDDGVGVPPELQPHIFDRFRQGDGSMTRAHGGLGLGLAIARHIVEAHGGSIAVESAGLGSGATFRVRLPYG